MVPTPPLPPRRAAPRPAPGFNEPNNLHNCNTDAQAVAEAWATVMKQWPHSMLVSPATAGNGIAWCDPGEAASKPGNVSSARGGTLGGDDGCLEPRLWAAKPRRWGGATVDVHGWTVETAGDILFLSFLFHLPLVKRSSLFVASYVPFTRLFTPD